MNTMKYVNGLFYIAGNSQPLEPEEVVERWNSREIFVNKLKEGAARHYKEQQELASHHETRIN